MGMLSLIRAKDRSASKLRHSIPSKIGMFLASFRHRGTMVPDVTLVTKAMSRGVSPARWVWTLRNARSLAKDLQP